MTGPSIEILFFLLTNKKQVHFNKALSIFCNDEEASLPYIKEYTNLHNVPDLLIC